MRRPRSLLCDEAGTSSVEYLLLTGLVALPLFLVYLVFWRGLLAEFRLLCFLFSQA